MQALPFLAQLERLNQSPSSDTSRTAPLSADITSMA